MTSCTGGGEGAKGLRRRLPLFTVNTTGARDWCTCPRFYQYKSVLGYRAVREPASRYFGTLVHRALEAWWTAAWWGQVTGRLIAALAALEDEPDHYMRARARAMMAAYHTQWVGVGARVVDIESTFEVDLINPDTGCRSTAVMFKGRLDVLIEIDGELWVVEHKTTREDISAGAHYWQRLWLDPQISNYIAGVRQRYGRRPAGVLYDVLRVPELKPLQVNSRRSVEETPDEYQGRIAEALAEDPGKYLKRRNVVRLREEEEEAARDLWATAGEIRTARRTGVFRRNRDACARFGSACEFLPVCARQASLGDTNRYQREET